MCENTRARVFYGWREEWRERGGFALGPWRPEEGHLLGERTLVSEYQSFILNVQQPFPLIIILSLEARNPRLRGRGIGLGREAGSIWLLPWSSLPALGRALCQQRLGISRSLSENSSRISHCVGPRLAVPSL